MRVAIAEARAFRMARHHLDTRLPANELLRVVGACAIQNTPPWAAGVSLAARLDGVTPDMFHQAVNTHRTLLQSWCMRGSPYFLPAKDIDVFTTGLRPSSEHDIRAMIQGVKPALKLLDMDANKAVDRAEEILPKVLAGRRLAINELGKEIADTIAGQLPPDRRQTWNAPGPYAENQTLGEGVVHFVLRVCALRQTICFAPRSGNKAPFVLVGEWLGRSDEPVEPDEARRELLRRYLRSFGPATTRAFAAWAGVSEEYAADSWTLLADELTTVNFAEGPPATILAADRESLTSSPASEGVRLLPPSDPYLHQSDRATILPDTTPHRKLWRPIGAPGAILLAGSIVGVWNARKQGKRLDLTVRPFDTLPESVSEAIATEAQTLAPFRGADRVALSFANE